MQSGKRALRAALLLAFTLALLTATGKASTSVGVAPSRLAFDLKPAEIRVFNLSYYNDGEEPLSVSAYPMDYFRRPDLSAIYLEPSGPLSGSSWIRVEPAAFSAPPRSRTRVTVTVEVPEDTPHGEYHAVVFLEASAPEGPGTLRLGARVGSVLYMAVGTDLVRAAALVPYRQAGPSTHPPDGFLPRLLHRIREAWRALAVGARHVPAVVTGRPFLVFVPIANRGNIHIRPEVTVRVRAGGESSVLRHLGEVILAGDARVIDLRWGGAPFVGVARLEVEVEYGGPEPLRATSAALVFPVDLLAGLVLIVLGLRLSGIRGITIQRAPRATRKHGNRVSPG